MLVYGNCSPIALSGHRTRTRQRLSSGPLRLHRGRPAPPLRRPRLPWTWSDYAGYRDVVNATGNRQSTSPASFGHSMLRLRRHGFRTRGRAPGGPMTRSAAMAAILARGDGRRRVGTLHVVPRRPDQSGRPVPSRAKPTGPEFGRLVRTLLAGGRDAVVWSRWCPTMLGPTAMGHAAANLRGSACGKRGIPITVEPGFTYIDSAPSPHASGGSTVATELRVGSRARAMYPQLSPRTVDMRPQLGTRR